MVRFTAVRMRFKQRNRFADPTRAHDICIRKPRMGQLLAGGGNARTAANCWKGGVGSVAPPPLPPNLRGSLGWCWDNRHSPLGPGRPVSRLPKCSVRLSGRARGGQQAGPPKRARNGPKPPKRALLPPWGVQTPTFRGFPAPQNGPNAPLQAAFAHRVPV